MKTLCPKSQTQILIAIAALSFTALAMAFISEGFLGLEPCILCIYQRYPFAIALLLSIIGLALKKCHCARTAILGVISLNFLTNSAIATYHTGVEQHWWKSAVEGCSIPLFEDNSTKSVLENIMSAPLGSCSEIPWQDPILGLSMANYNIILCLFLAALSAYGAVKFRKRPKPSKD